MPPSDIAILKQEMAVMAASVNKMEQAMVTIADSLKSLTRLEVMHSETRAAADRSLRAHADNEKRIREIEIAMPTLKLASNGFVRIVLVVITVIVAAVVGSVLIK